MGHDKLKQDISEQAQNAAAVVNRGLVAGVLSAVALAVSGVSLWETVLKEANLKVYVGDQISYTRDPWGGYEVLVVPLTVANGGARDSAVLSFEIEAKEQTSGRTEVFKSAYLADTSYYAGRDNVSENTRRPKAVFSPLAVSGRAAYSGTVLFYPESHREDEVVASKSKVELVLRTRVVSGGGLLGQPSAGPEPVKMTFEVPAYSKGMLLSGDFARLKVVPDASP